MFADNKRKTVVIVVTLLLGAVFGSDISVLLQGITGAADLMAQRVG